MAQLAKGSVLDFDSGLDLGAVRLSASVGSMLRAESAQDSRESLSLSLSPLSLSSAHALSLSL